VDPDVDDLQRFPCRLEPEVEIIRLSGQALGVEVGAHEVSVRMNLPHHADPVRHQLQHGVGALVLVAKAAVLFDARVDVGQHGLGCLLFRELLGPRGAHREETAYGG
jgi:hypothetical protein